MLDFAGAVGMGFGMSRLNIPSGQIRLFGSPLLESLTVVSARVFIVLWSILLPAILIGAALYAPTVWAPLLIVLGVLGWTLAEYALHRFVFHFEARSPGLQRAIFVIHGNHHAAPNDPLRNLMPPIVSVPVGGAIGLALVSVIGPEGAWCFFGFMLGYVSYDLVHYACHQWPMKSRLARILKVHHMRHHHLRAKGNYAITGMVWDRILSTRIVSPGERA